MVVADLDDKAGDREVVACEQHRNAPALVAVAQGEPHHLALLAVLDPVTISEALAVPSVVDLLAHSVAARQRRLRLTAHLCTDKRQRVGWEALRGRRLRARVRTRARARAWVSATVQNGQWLGVEDWARGVR